MFHFICTAPLIFAFHFPPPEGVKVNPVNQLTRIFVKCTTGHFKDKQSAKLALRKP